MKNRSLRFSLLILFLVLCIALGRIFKFDVDFVRSQIGQFPVAVSGLIFVVSYVILTFFIIFGPKDVLRIGAALLFGGTISTIFVYIAESINAAVLFLLARYLGQDYVLQKFKVKTGDLGKAEKHSGFWWALALRSNPVFPFRFLDLGYGLTAIDFKKYMLAVLIASPFRIFWLQYILAGLGETTFKGMGAMLQYFQENQFIVYYSGLYFLAVFVLTILAVVIQFFQRKNFQKEGES